MIHLIEYLGDKPKIGFIVAAIHAFTGTAIKLDMVLSGAGGGYSREAHVPAILMEYLQLGAWAVAILAGSLTIFAFFEKRLKKQ